MSLRSLSSDLHGDARRGCKLHFRHLKPPQARRGIGLAAGGFDALVGVGIALAGTQFDNSVTIKNRENCMNGMQTLEGLFKKEISEMFFAENQIAHALPRIVSEVSSEELKEALRQELDEAKEQSRRIEQFLGESGRFPVGQIGGGGDPFEKR
jgi:hypothetical protein